MVVIVVRDQSHPPGKLTCGGYMIQTMQRKILREASLENGIFYM